MHRPAWIIDYMAALMTKWEDIVMIDTMVMSPFGSYALQTKGP